MWKLLWLAETARLPQKLTLLLPPLAFENVLEGCGRDMGEGRYGHHLGDASRDYSCVSCPPSSTSRPGCLDWPPSRAQHLQGGTAPASCSRSFSHLKMQLRALRRRSMGPRREYFGCYTFLSDDPPSVRGRKSVATFPEADELS